ncbi:MAG: ATP-binding protein [Bacteroidetes bacterium]|nr:ATP-binding protein [Bacteroidota bacterium]
MVLAENQKLLIPSKAENMVLVEKLVDDVCDLFDIKEDLYGHILVALTEAVNNSLQHGNKANPDKNIEVTFKMKDSKLFFTVKDHGPGFDHTNLPDPTDPKNIEKPTGRGIFLMKHLSDNVSFEDKGTKVILEFILNKQKPS